MKFLEALRENDPSSPIAYHLEGILEAHENIRLLLETLGADPSPTPESRPEILTRLQVEIYTHLALHMKELRGPLKKLIVRSFEGLPELGEEEEAAIKKKLDRYLRELKNKAHVFL